MRFGLGVLICVRILAQSSPDAAALLARQQQEFERHRSYEFTEETSTSVKTPGMTMPAMNSTTVTQAVNPGKMRTEMKMAAAAGGVSVVTVSDGTQIWTYMPLMNRYTRTQGGNDADAAGAANEAAPEEITASAKVTGSELLEVDGEQRDCWVLESSAKELTAPPLNTKMQDAAYKVWIDKQLGIQWKSTFSAKVHAAAAAPSMETSLITTIHSLKFDADLPDSLFVFTPPPGAAEAAELVPGMQAMLGGSGADAGTKAPARAASKEPVKPAVPGEPEAFVPYLQPVHQVEAVRPTDAGDLQGVVEVLATIDATGAVTDTEALSGRAIFRSPAVDAVRQWTFHPVLRNGHAVAAYTEVAVDFLLEDKPPGNDFGFDLADEMKAQQRIQELTAKFPRSPEQVLADTEEQQRGSTGEARFFALRGLAREALDAGDLVKAKAYATEVLEKTPQAKTDFGGVDVTDTETYDANTVLGLVALREGSVSQARQYLLESAKARPSSAVSPFGPDLTLARELLAKGERDAVIEFLTECKGFWKSGAEQLDGMIASVRNGQTF